MPRHARPYMAFLGSLGLLALVVYLQVRPSTRLSPQAGAGLVQVLCAGDSISHQYAPYLAWELHNRAIVATIPENGQNSRYQLAHAEEWYGDKHWDAVIIGCGHWDVVSGLPGGSPVPRDEYGRNVEELVRRVRGLTGARVYWITQTLDHPPSPREASVVLAYRAAGIEAARAARAEIIDVARAIEKATPAQQEQWPDGTHFRSPGCALIARTVAAALRQDDPRLARASGPP